jgi:hypothetical protein
MLTILGPKSPRSGYCDGVSRRNFLKIGSLGLGGLALPQLLRAESASGIRSAGQPHKAVIMIFLPGGPSHQDMFDLKWTRQPRSAANSSPSPPTFPALRSANTSPASPNSPINTPIIRSMVGMEDRHDAITCHTGRHPATNPRRLALHGFVLGKLRAPATPPFPPSSGSPENGPCALVGQRRGRLPRLRHAPFEINKGGGKDDMILNGITLDRLADRRTLLRFPRRLPARSRCQRADSGLDAYTQQAFGILTSSKLVEALDLKNEDPKLVERYGKGDPRNRDDGGPKLMEHFLIARRLVEAGARCVTLAFSRWDHHGDNFGALRQDLPLLDQGLSACWKTPSARPREGRQRGGVGRVRSHPDDQQGRRTRPLAAGQLRPAGRRRHEARPVIGSTDRLGGEAASRPVLLRRSPRHAVSQPGHRREQGDRSRSHRAPAVPGRQRPPTHAGTGGIGAFASPCSTPNHPETSKPSHAHVPVLPSGSATALSRRNFLRIGALGMGGLAVPQLLRAESQSGIRSSHKAVIMIYLPGGPPHQDTFDLKLDAPVRDPRRVQPHPHQRSRHPDLRAPAAPRRPWRTVTPSSVHLRRHRRSLGLHVPDRPAQEQPTPGGWPTMGASRRRFSARRIPGIPRSSAWNRACSIVRTTRPMPGTSAWRMTRSDPRRMPSRTWC